MRVLDIYKRFDVPPNLQKHMARVSRLAMFICNHWKGEKIDRNLVKKAGLLHDIGNIVKFDLETRANFLGEKEIKRVDYWKEVQRKIIEKYGSDDHEVTKRMLQEIGTDERLVELLGSKTYANAVSVANSDDWEAKILLYADLRIGPFGIMGLKERLDELHKRSEKYRERKDLYIALLEIEEQIQKNLTTKIA